MYNNKMSKRLDFPFLCMQSSPVRACPVEFSRASFTVDSFQITRYCVWHMRIMRASSYNNKKSKRLDFQFLCSPVQCGLVQSNSVEPRSKSVHFKSQGTVYGTCALCALVAITIRSLNVWIFHSTTVQSSVGLSSRVQSSLVRNLNCKVQCMQ